MKKILALLALLSVCLHSSATEYITNGTFNEPSHYYTESQRGWETTSTLYYFAYNTYFSVFGDGTLSQKIIGATGPLQLSFDFATSVDAPLPVFWNGVEVASVISDNRPATFESTVIGTGNDTLAFLTSRSGYYTIRNVSLTSAVPEPEAYVMMLGGLALVGFAARRRKVRG